MHGQHALKKDRFMTKPEVHIIFLDDDLALLNSLELSLTNKLVSDDYFQYNLIFMNNPISTLELIDDLIASDEEIGLIVADHIMPEMMGIDFLREAKKKLPNTMKMLLTGYAGTDAAISSINEKILNRYMTKPIENMDAFVETLKSLLRDYRMNKMAQEQKMLMGNLIEFKNSLGSKNSLAEQMNYIITFLTRTLMCDCISIYTLENQKLVLKAGSGNVDAFKEAPSIQIKESSFKSLVGSRHDSIVAENLKDLSWIDSSADNFKDNECLDFPMAYGVIKSSREPFGVIIVSKKKKGRPFNENDLEALSFIINIASLSLLTST